MANPQLLDIYWHNSGRKKVYLAEKADISRPRLDYIFSHPETATVGQADVLCKEMSINANDRKDIFLP